MGKEWGKKWGSGAWKNEDTKLRLVTSWSKMHVYVKDTILTVAI